MVKRRQPRGRADEEKEKAAAVEIGNKQKEAASQAWCWKGFLLWSLKKTGEL